MSTLVRSAMRAGWRPGPDPRALEAFLRDLGFLVGRTGRPATAADIGAGLRRFQSAAGLEVDGVPTRSTVHALARAHHALLDLRALAA